MFDSPALFSAQLHLLELILLLHVKSAHGKEHGSEAFQGHLVGSELDLVAPFLCQVANFEDACVSSLAEHDYLAILCLNND